LRHYFNILWSSICNKYLLRFFCWIQCYLLLDSVLFTVGCSVICCWIQCYLLLDHVVNRSVSFFKLCPVQYHKTLFQTLHTPYDLSFFAVFCLLMVCLSFVKSENKVKMKINSLIYLLPYYISDRISILH